MKPISKKLQKLKAENAASGDITEMVKRLKKEGILNGGALTGEVIFFNDVKGYGFIKAANGASYFLHCSEIKAREYPVKGDCFRFHVTNKNRVIKAVKIN